MIYFLDTFFFAYMLDILRIFSWDLASTRTFSRHDAKCSRVFDDRFPRGLCAWIEKRLAVKAIKMKITVYPFRTTLICYF